MAATVELRSYHGAGGGETGTDVAGGNMRFKQADNDTVDANNPVPIPGAGSNYSYVKNMRLWVTAAPSNGINNLKYYTDGSNPLYGTGIVLYVGTRATYLDPTTQTTTFFGGYDARNYTSGAPLSVSGSIGATTGALGDYVVLQIGVGSTATQGTSGSEVLTWSFDES